MITEKSSNTSTGKDNVKYVQNNEIQFVCDWNVSRNRTHKYPSLCRSIMSMVYYWWLVKEQGSTKHCSSLAFCLWLTFFDLV